MPLTNNLKIKLKTLLALVIGWQLIALIISAYNHMFFVSAQEYDFMYSLIASVLAVLIAGITAGPLLVFVLKDRFKRHPLGLTLIIYTVTIVVLITLVSVVASFFYNSINMDLPFYHADVVRDVEIFLIKDYGLWLNLMTWMIIAVLTVLAMQVNEKYGQGVFKNMLLGKYHQPRIFMFLDLKGSTTIAEKIGNISYFKLLSKFFEDISSPIIESYGEIYQYVGDEVVVSWSLKKGIEDAHCLRVFFEIINTIDQKSHEYQARFGLVPAFKAGIHVGEITVGEVGTIKKDIIFSGDVLNTTARIQEQCNILKQPLLVSKQLLSLLPIKDYFSIEPLGQIELRGKMQPVTLCAVSQVPVKPKPMLVTSE